MNEQPGFDFDRVKDPVPQEVIDNILERIEDFESRFDLDALKSITKTTDKYDKDQWETAQAIFYDMQHDFVKMCNEYDVLIDVEKRLEYRLKAISDSIGHYDSISGTIVHKNDQQ